MTLSLNKPKLDNLAFAVSMAVYGIGMGAVFSQLGNINMSSVGTEKASEVGGLQGTAQNLGGAILAAVACGEYPTVEAAARAIVKVRETISPDPELVSAYQKKYLTYRTLYPAIKGLL